VNGRIAAGENDAIQVTKHGATRTWTRHTPPPREIPNHMLYERLPQASFSQVLAAVDGDCGFMDAFDHVLGRATHHQRDDRVLAACLLAWGTNVGLHRMGEMSDIPPSTLVRTSGNYLRLETLRAASTTIINALAAMPFFHAFDIGGQQHSSSDGQKFMAGIDTLKAQHSPRYFGMGKGVVADTLVLNHIPIATVLISAHDPESDDVFDLLYNNLTEVKSTIHSTDTHGTNRVNFAILSMFGHRFAPRYADVQERMRTSLYGFQPPAAYGADALFRPVRKLNTELIVSEWDQLQRIFVSLAQKTISQRILIAKLSGSKRRNRTLQELWEYDHILRSQYLLEFVDSPRLRQNVQQALNRGEQYHHLRRALTHGNIGKLRYVTEEEQELWNEACRLLVNAILFYNMRILEQAITAREAAGELADAAFLHTVSPVAWHHINFGGRITFFAEQLPAPIAASVAAVLTYRRSVAEHPGGTPGGHDAGEHQGDDEVDELDED
jgi:TnpA family transposase